ncbi:PAS domain S-box protein [Candidatus Peregrinibacteria bacterium]|nr:PAS domain S-box protein [Candidatus Peregrinibacteria bacterium]
MKTKDITQLVSLRTLQKIQDFYTTALGFSLSIRNSEGEQIIKPTFNSKLWDFVTKHPEMEKKLSQNLLDAYEKCERTGQVIIFERCPDTLAFVAPINFNGHIIAFFVGGMVRQGNPNLDTALLQAENMNVSIDEYLDAYLNLPLITYKKLEAAGNLIKVIGSTISNLEFVGSEFKLKNIEVKKKNKQLSYELNKTTYSYKSIFDNVFDGIYVSNLDGRFIDMNIAGARLLGYKDPKDLIGKETKSVYVYPEDRERYIKQVKSKGYIKNWIAHIKTPAGEEKFLETNATAIKDKNGKIDLIQGIFRDINHRQHRNI